MCGIVGFVGDEAAPVVLKAVTRLEYRGYDSAGMVSLCDGRLYLKKDVGGIRDVQRKHRLDRLPGDVALAHVRWATHGRADRANAHPLFDCSGRIAVVHNGIIENFQGLRAQLAARHRFVSDADTEVVCHLIEDYMDEGASLEEALLRAADVLEGSYALAVIAADGPPRIVAITKDSPLAVGIGDGSYFVASDALSFLDQCNRVVFLEEGEVASLSRDGVTFRDREGRRLAREPQELDWQWPEATREGYDSFMLKEIKEGPDVILRALDQDRDTLVEFAQEISRARQVVLTGCGTSRHAALLGSYLLSRMGGKLCHVVTASEFRYLAHSLAEDALVVAVSQSGETADVVEVARQARSRGVRVFSIVNVVGSLLSRTSDRVLYLNCGPEVGVAATKSFIAQMVVFYLIAFALAGRLAEGTGMMRAASQKMREGLERDDSVLKRLAQEMKDRDHFLYIARGLNLPIAAEGALKLKEVSYVHAEWMSAGELKHGTLALIEEGTPIVALCPRDDTFQETLSNIMETRARGGLVTGISSEDNEGFDHWIEVPEVDEALYPLVATVPLQLLAYHMAVARGKDPDRPRNLAKSVTVK